ncbi:MAG: NAD(P)H-hydrate dehydratase [Chloroflexota bacterium]
MRLITAAEMKVIDRQATRRYGLPEIVLMENAGLRVVEAVSERYGAPAGLAVLVICGKGNNGGDGLVAARHLANAGARVRVYLVADPAALAKSTAINYKIFRECGGSVAVIPDDADWRDRLAGDLELADVVIDALLGTGISGFVQGVQADVIEAVNAAGRPVVAVDLPSGVNADTGAVCGVATRAELTVTFGAPKPGLILHPGAELAGELIIADISLPADLLAPIPGGLELLTIDEAADLLPRRAPTAHKGDAGRLAVIAGSRGFTGAAALAAQAAVRTGAGLVTVLAPAAAQAVLAVKLTEAMTVAAPETAAGQLAEQAAPDVLHLAARANAVAIGPGLGTGGGVETALRLLLSQTGAPLVIDADGLNVLAEAAEGTTALLAAALRPIVLTPHPGEMARLTGLTIGQVEADRIGVARRLAGEAKCTVVLKGAPTVVAAADGRAWLNSTGNPGMASGGMGDALTGAIAALIAQGLAPLDAALAGVLLHGLAADIAAEQIGAIGFTAGDVVERLPQARQRALAAATGE